MDSGVFFKDSRIAVFKRQRVTMATAAANFLAVKM